MSNGERVLSLLESKKKFAEKAKKYIPIPQFKNANPCFGCVAYGAEDLCNALCLRSIDEGYDSEHDYCYGIIWATNSKKHRVLHIAMRMTRGTK